MLTKKQRTSNQEWIETFADIKNIVSKDEIDLITEETIKDIISKTENKKVAYAWSGGKDSIVLGKICELVGISDSLIGVCDLEYPSFYEWIEKNKPEHCTVINTGQDLEWLSKHPNMLFPSNSQIASQWFSIVQHRAQKEYFKKNNLDILILGRRKADGNYVGKGDNIYTDGKGVTRYSPLSNWKHEHILAFIYYNNLPLPPIYQWENGYLCGTHPWPARQWTKTIDNGWREVYNIDRSIVEAAAEYLPSAKSFLKEVAKCK